MKLEHISAVLRPRSDAEAVDLGLAMVRRHAAGVYKGWFLFLLPLWGLLTLVLSDYPQILVLVVWWLKPLYDRVTLFYLGRALFGAAPSLKEQLREWPRLLTRRLGLSLLWGRLSSSRSFTMPVVVLEGLTGKLYQSRTSILNKHGGAAAFGFMQVFLLLELAVIIGLWAGLSPLLPEDITEWLSHPALNLQRDIPPPSGLLWALAACYMMAVALLEPFYAGGGFGLYINSRTHLEGWDVDLAFRQLGSRLSAKTGTSSSHAAGILALILTFGLAGPSAAPAADKQEAAQQIKEILAHPDFTEHVEKTKTWEPDWSWLKSKKPAPPTTSPEPAGWDWGWLQGVADAVKKFFSGDWKEIAFRLIWATALAALLFWLGRLVWRALRLHRPAAPRPGRGPGPRVVMGMEVTPESLPPDVPTAAWLAWQAGDTAGAVRLLYRGSLAWLMEQGTVPIRESDTEGDCLRHAGALPDAARRAYFSDLTHTWLATAYGKTPPEDAGMRALCDRWPFALTAPMDPSPARAAAPGLTLLMVVGASLFLTGCKGQWKEKEKEIGHLGEAKKNPWLAATRLLEKNGYPVLVQRGVLDLPDPDSVLMVPADAISSAALARHVIDWTRRGGHVIYVAAGGEHYHHDWGSYGSGGSSRPEMHPLLAELGVRIMDKAGGAATADSVRIGETEFNLSLAEDLRFDVSGATGPVGFVAGSSRDTPLASMESGNGRITLLADGHAFRNRWIDDDDHAALLLALTAQTGQVYSVSFIKAGRVSLWDMLWEYAWTALLAAGFLLAFWLWSVLLLFGPMRALNRRQERRFATHLEESGAFLWKEHLTDALLEAPRQAVLSAARRQGLRPGDRWFTSLLATRAGLPPERVDSALQGGTTHDARLLTRQLADLQTLLHSFDLPRLPAA